jgi:hypothetical protein
MFTMLIGREAGNQKDDAMLCMAWSVKNRVLRPGFWNWGRDWEGVIEAKWQYSSIEGLQSDPNLLKYPNLNVEPWERCLNIAVIVYDGLANDPTDGSTHYHDISLDPDPAKGRPDKRPIWAKNGRTVHVMDCGSFHFFRPSEIGPIIKS